MDGLTLLGLLIAFLAIAGGQWLEGGSLYSLFNLSAFIIVLGGTFGAVMLQTPKKEFRRAFKILPWIFNPRLLSAEFLSTLIVDWSKTSRKYGLLKIEDDINKLTDPLLIKGAELLVSGVPIDAMKTSLEIEIDNVELHNLQAAKVFESMGGYSPTIGIMGAVLGLIQVMQHLSSPSELGAGIAVAFVATIYGVGFANLVFLPIANKLKHCVYEQSRLYEMFLTGLLALSGGDNPRMIEMKLSGFILAKENKGVRNA